MAGRPGGRNSGSINNSNRRSRDEHYNRDPRLSTSRGVGPRPSTSRGRGGYLECHNLNQKRVTFKSSNNGNNHFRKNWENKTGLIRKRLDSKFPKRIEQLRSESCQWSFPERNNSRDNNNFRNLPFTLIESLSGWYKVIVPNVEDCNEILSIIQTYIRPILFFPYNKHMLNKALIFLVDDFEIAKTLHNTSYKITLKDGHRVIIKVYPYIPSRALTSFTPVSSEVRKKMVEAMAICYNSSTKSLNLSQFYACPLFTENQLFVPLNRPAVLLAALNMFAQRTIYSLSLKNNHIYLGEGLVWIRRLFPELKVLDLAGNKLTDLKAFKILSGFTIENLNLSRNPVCDTEDKESYRRNLQQLFPKLNKLDNLEFPTQYSVALVGSLKMPIYQVNSYPVPEGHNPEQPNPVMNMVESFLIQYYELYDNQVSRQLVVEAYHENASFTLSSCFLPYPSKGSSNLSKYQPEGQNNLRQEIGKNRFLLKGRENVINFIDQLPKTKHDYGSFLVDVPIANGAMVQIVVNGVFAEDFNETNVKTLYRSFSRTFCIVPVGNGWSILSDMLFVTAVTDELLLESSKRFHSLKTKNSSSNSDNITRRMFMLNI